MREDFPARYRELITSLGRRKTIAKLSLDGEHMAVRLDGQRLAVIHGETKDRGAGTRIITSGEMVVALLDGRLALEDAVETKGLFVAGDPYSLEAFTRVVEAILSVAPSSSRMIELLRTFRKDVRRGKRRTR